MEDTLFANLNTFIRIKELDFLSKEQFEAILKSKSLEQALQLLKSTIYADVSLAYEKALNAHLVQVYQEVIAEVPEHDVTDIFSLVYVYHNLKVLLKTELTGLSLDHLLLPVGRYTLEELTHAVKMSTSDTLPDSLLQAIEHVKLEYAEYQRIEAIDILLDRAYFEHLIYCAHRLNVPFICDMVYAWIDLYNSNVLLRLAHQPFSRSYLTSVLSDNGHIPLNQLIDLAMSKRLDSVYATLMSAPYAQALEIEKENFNAFMVEKNRDSVVHYYLQQAKLEPFGVLPILAYLYYKEMEIKNLRLMLSAKENGIDEQTIRERMRPVYDV